jgi:hypothetical protein
MRRIISEYSFCVIFIPKRAADRWNFSHSNLSRNGVELEHGKRKGKRQIPGALD